MSLFANIGDKITFYNDVECNIIGISVLLYKTKKTYYTLCEYKLKKNLDNSIWYLEDDFETNKYKLFSLSDNKISKKYHFRIEPKGIKTITREYFVLQAIGDTDYKEKETIKYKYDQSEKDFYIIKNATYYNGVFLTQDDIKKTTNSNNELPLSIYLPVISKFHDDNKIRNKSYSIKEGFGVGDGLLINDQECFVLSQSTSNIDSVFSNEYKLYNNNTNQYCWLKYFNDRYYFLSETEEFNNDNNSFYSNYKKRVSYISDWETMNNTECMFHLSRDLDNKVLLKEEWQHKTEYFQGIDIDDKQLKVIKYDYTLPKPSENINIEPTKISEPISVKRTNIKQTVISLSIVLGVCLLLDNIFPDIKSIMQLPVVLFAFYISLSERYPKISIFHKLKELKEKKAKEIETKLREIIFNRLRK
ncbi:MAG: hypothetical protein MJ211_09030 [Bacteroidales bacterium]|nr:hypothetical protein [Bacteroidales bacterium]